MNTEDKLIVVAKDLKDFINCKGVIDLANDELEQYALIRKQLRVLADTISIRKQKECANYDASFAQSFGLGHVNKVDLNEIPEAEQWYEDEDLYCQYCGCTELNFIASHASTEEFECRDCKQIFQI